MHSLALVAAVHAALCVPVVDVVRVVRPRGIRGSQGKKNQVTGSKSHFTHGVRNVAVITGGVNRWLCTPWGISY